MAKWILQTLQQVLKQLYEITEQTQWASRMQVRVAGEMQEGMSCHASDLKSDYLENSYYFLFCISAHCSRVMTEKTFWAALQRLSRCVYLIAAKAVKAFMGVRSI